MQEKTGTARNAVSQASLTPDILPGINTLELTEITAMLLPHSKALSNLLAVFCFVTEVNMKLSNKHKKRGNPTAKQLEQHKSMYITFW